MCEFPSWIHAEDGKDYWLTDNDIKAAIEDGKLKDWVDSTGHSAIEKVLGVKGEHREGKNPPDNFASEIRGGSCKRMISVELSQAYNNVPELIEKWIPETYGGYCFFCSSYSHEKKSCPVNMSLEFLK